MNKQQQAGYTLMELLIVVLVISILLTTLVVNLGAIVSTVDIEEVTIEVNNNICSARRAALSGNPKLSAKFDIKTAVPAKHPGILIQSQSIQGTLSPCSVCPKAGNTQPAALCVSGRQFCYDPQDTFTFNQFSGDLTDAHAIFIVSQRRTLAVLVSSEGKTDIAEKVNGQWRTRSDLQGLIKQN